MKEVKREAGDMECRPNPNEKKTRFEQRVPIQCSLVIANGVQVDEGWAIDLSMCGCLVDGAVRVKAGDRLQLCLCLPDSHPSICVSVAVVRWVHGRRFGLEFMRVDDKYRAHLNRFITLQADPWARAHD